MRVRQRARRAPMRVVDQCCRLVAYHLAVAVPAATDRRRALQCLGSCARCQQRVRGRHTGPLHRARAAAIGVALATVAHALVAAVGRANLIAVARRTGVGRARRRARSRARPRAGRRWAARTTSRTRPTWAAAATAAAATAADRRRRDDPTSARSGRFRAACPTFWRKRRRRVPGLTLVARRSHSWTSRLVLLMSWLP